MTKRKNILLLLHKLYIISEMICGVQYSGQVLLEVERITPYELVQRTLFEIFNRGIKCVINNLKAARIRQRILSEDPWGDPRRDPHFVWWEHDEQ